MKKQLLIAGMMLFPALLPMAASADDPAPDYSCATVLGLTPVSPYVQKVMDRAEAGIAYAKTSDAAVDFLNFLGPWALSLRSAWAGLTDTSIQRVENVQALRTVSACLHLDLTMIDCEIEKVRQELRAQTTRGSYVAIMRLTSLFQFLDERRRQLSQGALDPQYPDPTWGERYPFDPPAPVWCVSDDPKDTCTQISSDECLQKNGKAYETLADCTTDGGLPPPNLPADTGRICPFSADYAPASDTGFGCDASIMEPRKAYTPVNAELTGLKAINDSLASYRKAAVETLKLQQQINNLFGGQTSSQPPQNITNPHVNAFGCGWTGGWCADDTTKRCISNDDCANTCVFSNKMCDKNRAIRCTDDSQCGSDGPCVSANEPPLQSLRGNFSLDRDQLAILNSFLGTRSEQEISRVFRQDLQTPDEIPANNPDLKAQRAAENDDPLLRVSRAGYRMTIQTWSRIQALAESLMYPQDIDATLEAAHALSDLHTNISEIARIASQKDGLRDFVTRYAWFLRRSCIYRSCNLILDQSIKLSTTDECFPYANGSYLDSMTGTPQWQKCKDAAKIK